MPIFRLSSPEQGVSMPLDPQFIRDLGRSTVHMLNHGAQLTRCEPVRRLELTPPGWRELTHRHYLTVHESGETAVLEAIAEHADSFVFEPGNTASVSSNMTILLPQEADAVPITRVSADGSHRRVYEMIIHVPHMELTI